MSKTKPPSPDRARELAEKARENGAEALAQELDAYADEKEAEDGA